MGQPRRSQVALFALVASTGAIVFLLGLGDTGVVDETPALFAASAHRMVETGDWLVPWVNGLPRYDKPPLVYWLMALACSLPGQATWDPLGSLAVRLPSALASIAVMLALADTVRRWPQAASPIADCRGLPLSASLAFALSPLALVWGRTEVSDALFSALLAISLLLAWRSYAAAKGPWWSCWPPLALATLTKGPVALVLAAITFVLFAALQRDLPRLRQRLQPLRGLAFTALLAAPWYLLVLAREGEPYWRSFFGYHNLQRFSRVVNNHQQSWWYFGAVMLLASLPWTPLLLLGLKRALLPLRPPPAPEHSLLRFAASWLLAVLLFFSVAATKLPSYWLPATPAAALLVSLASGTLPASRASRTLTCSAPLLLVLAAGLAAAPLWVPWIEDPSIPDLHSSLLDGPWFALGAAATLAAALLSTGAASPSPVLRLAQSQLTLLLLVPLLLLPLARQLDQLRGAPLRTIAAVAAQQRQQEENLAMVGLMKPSLHYYSRATVIYEGRSPEGLLNLVDRLADEHRPGLQPTSTAIQPSVLVVIDRKTSDQPHWRGWQGLELAARAPYQLLRIDRRWLEHRAQQLLREGHKISWRESRPERY
jgi:4-amino-4-deoxy-L-arabinose transferase-like glycosyltransferase